MRTNISAFLACTLLFAGVAMLVPPFAQAAPGINPEIPFHGVLKDALGDPLTGSYDMTFVIYDAPTGGSALWTGLYTVTVTDGTFKVMLGSGGSAFGALDFTDDTYYIGLAVEADAEMTPRHRIGASAYAFNADKLDGYDSSYFLGLSASTSMATTSATTLFTLTQNGAGDILNLLSSSTEVFTVLSTGMVGIGTSSPQELLTVSGDSRITGHSAFGNIAVKDGVPSVEGYYDFYEGDPSTSRFSSVLSIGEEFESFTDDYYDHKTGLSSFLIADPQEVMTNWTNIYGVYSKVRTATDSPGSLAASSDLAGGYFEARQNQSVNAQPLNVYSVYGHADNSSDQASWVYGAYISAFSSGSAQEGEVFGGTFNPGVTGTSRMDAVYGLQTATAFYDTGKAQDAYGIYLRGPYGTNAIAGITNNYGLYIGDQSPYGTSTSFNIYSAGTNSKNYFGGKVGIGTTTPDLNLTIETGNANSVGLAIDGYNASRALLQGSLNNGMFFALTKADGSNSHLFRSYGNSYINQGNFGIGTFSPSVQLHIMSTTTDATQWTQSTSSTNQSIVLAANEDASQYAYLAQHGSSYAGTMDGISRAGLSLLAFNGTNALIRSMGTAPMIFSTNGGERMRITSTGNIGIGTTSPQELLTVSGDSRITGHSAFGNIAVKDGVPSVEGYYDFWEGDPATSRFSSVLSVAEEFQSFTDDYWDIKTGVSSFLVADPQADMTNWTSVYGVYSKVRTASSSSASLAPYSDLAGGYFEAVQNPSVNLLNVYGVRSSAYNTSDQPSRVYGGYLSAFSTGSAQGGNVIGGYFNPLIEGTSRVDGVSGIETATGFYESGRAQNAYGIYVYAPYGDNVATGITNNYGLYIEDHSPYGTSTSYNIYSAGTNSKNYFGGNIGISTTTPVSALTLASSTSVTGGITMGDVNLYRGGSNLLVLGTAESTDSLIALGSVIAGIGMQSPALFGGDTSGADLILESTSHATKGDIYLNSSGGYVGIGTTTPTATLTASGTIRFSSFGAGTLTSDTLGNITASSDERLKDIEGPFVRGIDALNAIEPILYRWNEQSGYDMATVYAGFSAQDIQEAIPEAVGESKNGFLTLSDRPILAAVVNAVKELYVKMEEYFARTETLEAENAELKARVEALEEAVGVEPGPENTGGGSQEPVPEEPTPETPGGGETSAEDQPSETPVEEPIVEEVPSEAVPDEPEPTPEEPAQAEEPVADEPAPADEPAEEPAPEVTEPTPIP